jgi:hypothetical protein
MYSPYKLQEERVKGRDSLGELGCTGWFRFLPKKILIQ